MRIESSGKTAQIHKLIRALLLANAISTNITYIRPGYIGGCVAQSVTCLATDASLTADPGVVSLIQARAYIFVEIDYEIISTVILLPSAESFKKDCYHLQAKVCTLSTG